MTSKIDQLSEIYTVLYYFSKVSATFESISVCPKENCLSLTWKMRMDSIFSYMPSSLCSMSCVTLFSKQFQKSNSWRGLSNALKNINPLLTIVTLPHRLSPRNTNKINASLLSLGQVEHVHDLRSESKSPKQSPRFLIMLECLLIPKFLDLSCNPLACINLRELL